MLSADQRYQRGDDEIMKDILLISQVDPTLSSGAGPAQPVLPGLPARGDGEAGQAAGSGPVRAEPELLQHQPGGGHCGDGGRQGGLTSHCTRCGPGGPGPGRFRPPPRSQSR